MSPALTATQVFTNLVIALCMIPLVCGVFLKAPKLVAAGFLAILFLFADSTWGQLQVEDNIYSRGSGMFHYSLLNLLLLTAGMAALVKRLLNPQGPQLAPPMNKYLAAFLFLLAAHIVTGLMVGIELEVILGYRGVFNVLNMLIFFYVMTMAFSNDGSERGNDTSKLLLLLLLLAAARGVFGIVRYFMFDGDSANPYRNFEGMNIRIMFFDISDNFVAALGAFCAAWMLTAPGTGFPVAKRLLLLALLVLEVTVVALSYRRSSLIGLSLMMVFLLIRMPGHRKVLLACAAAIGLLTMGAIFYEQRLQFAGAEDGLTALIYDITMKHGIKESRFYELYAAAQSMEDHWLFGRGTWGSFIGDRDRLSYHGDDFSFVHSGFGHMLLKTGLVGLLLFCGILAAFIGFYRRHRHALSGDALLVADAGFAGFLFWFPTLLIGTPIIEFRTMLLIGLTLAMPFIAVGVQHRQRRLQPAQDAYAVA